MNKYHNVKTTISGITFDSKKEADRYIVLKAMEKVGTIQNLRLQVPFELSKPYKIAGKTVKGTKYIADFVYELNGKLVVEDVKGVKTAAYRIKRNWMHEKYGIVIREV